RAPPLDVRTGRTGAGYPADLVGAAGIAGHERPDHGDASWPHWRRAEPGPGDPGKDHGDGHRCSVTTMRERGRELTIVAALAMLSGYLSLTQANFRDAFTISTILTNAAYVAVVGIGMTIVIVAGQIDISVGSILLAHTVFGREIYAAGSHPQAAQLNGIDTARVTFWVFALNGLLVGLATMLHVTRFSMVQTQEGLGLEFLVITAVVVGGTNIFG